VIFCLVLLFLLALPIVIADNYTTDISFVTSKNLYSINERIEIKGNLYLSNRSSNGTLMSNHSGLINASLNITIFNKVTNVTNGTYELNTTAGGIFYSKSDFYSSETLISAPSTPADYLIKVDYIDPNGSTKFTQTEVRITNQSVDKLDISSDKTSYRNGDNMTLLVEAMKEVEDEIIFVANVSVNGTIRNINKTTLSSFNCTTGANGKCTINTTTPGDGDYVVEISNFKGFSSFVVTLFDVNILMKDELGKSIKHKFDKGEQASIEVGVITNNQSEFYNFNGTIKNSDGVIIKNITATELNTNNSYTNRFTFTLDALNFQAGTYQVEVNTTKVGGATVGTTTSFEVRSWDLLVKKAEVDSGFESEYSTFPNATVNIEIYPSWRGNGSTIPNINSTSSINISLVDTFNNQISITNATLNTSCGTEGCYEFSLEAPGTSGEYLVTVTVDNDGDVQTAQKKINVISATVSAIPSNKDGSLKDLFGTNEFVYISLSAKNTTSSTNLTSASIKSVIYMNGTEIKYAKTDGFDLVNISNGNLEWAWNTSQQRLKLDPPSRGGLYTVHLTAENNTIVTSSRFIVNPYDVCSVAKNTPGQAGGTTDYYYVYQFKTNDKIYFELKLTQADNPLGRASFLNVSSNSSHGMGSACNVNTQTDQVVNNATITVEEVTNTRTGKLFSLNTSETNCQADDSEGGYTCTIASIGNWDGGSYGVKFKIVSQDGQTSDIAYAGFEARAFYIHAWSSNWKNKPNSNITLNVYMYEAGDNWWGNYGSGGLSGSVSVEKVEYQGRQGEWIWPPIDYGYNASKINTSTVTNGQGVITLPANETLDGKWKTGQYRAILKGTDTDGNTDYGYAWFGIRKWEVYASPVECISSSCVSVYNLNSKSNISLYITINNAGEWGQGSNDLGGNVNITVKKIQDCRTWPCKDLNASNYNSTIVNTSTSSSWYWGSSIDKKYLLNITPATGSWGTGYWQVVLDINNSETGTGWFNTIAFYVESQPTDVNGTNWQYSIKNKEPKYFKVTSVKTQKSGYYYSGYNTSDYLNTTIRSAVLRRWDQNTGKSIEYNHPSDINITLVGGGTVINGTKVVNVSISNGSNWVSGYYSGELTLANLDNETATAYMWFQVRPFRVSATRNQYEIDNDVCVNGTINIYDPDWRTDSVLNGIYNITSVTERTWTNTGSTLTTYTNFTPTGSFNGTINFSICYNGNKWGSGSWGNYHYLTIRMEDNESNSEDGWLSFRTLPFSIKWGSIIGGTDVALTNNVQATANLTKATSGINASGNLSNVYQWRYESGRSIKESYDFSVGSCNTQTAGTVSCMINGSQTVTIYAPISGWREGYNYLQAEWTEFDDAGASVQDSSSIWFNGKAAYRGWWVNIDENGGWKSNFGTSENLSIKLYLLNSSDNVVEANITKVEYSTPSTSCWEDYCRTYNDATYSIVGQTTNNFTDNAIIRLVKPAANWSKGYTYIRATINGVASEVIKNGQVYVKDTTAPSLFLTTPPVGANITNSTFWINWTTTESSTCYIYLRNYDSFNSWWCGSWNSTNSTNSTSNYNYCNATNFDNGPSYYYEYIGGNNYRTWNNGTTHGWRSGSTGLVTGGTSHYYQYTIGSIINLINQDYGVRVECYDADYNYVTNSTAFNINITLLNTTVLAIPVNITLILPTNASTITTANVSFNYSYSGVDQANCTLYGNFTGNWLANVTSNLSSSGGYNFDINLSNGTYIWNVYCLEIGNTTNTDWGNANWTFLVNTTSSNQINVVLVAPTNKSTVTTGNVSINFSFSGISQANCSLYGNFTGDWLINQTANLTSSGSYSFNRSLSNGTYLWNVYCADSGDTSNNDWGDANWTFTLDNSTSPLMNVSLAFPINASSMNLSKVTFNYTFSNMDYANCSLYGNSTGSWALNVTSTNLSSGPTYFFNESWINGTFIWNVYCVNYSSANTFAWADTNWTFTNNYTIS